MTVTSTTLRVDVALEEELRQLISNLGLDMSTYSVMSAKQAVREQGIPFKITINVPNVETIKTMQDTRDGIGLSKGSSPVSALMEELNADD